MNFMVGDLDGRTDDALLVITFLLGDAAFGISAAHVQEVARLGSITPVHHAAFEVVGIRNLRGRIVTVIDLRTRLGLGSVCPGAENRILIVESLGEPIGLLVDCVADTISISPGQILPPPANVPGSQGRNLVGVCHSGERLIALLDPGAVTLPEKLPAAATSEAEAPR
jgi:purine-binding chemotaxis protein CheW